FALLEVIRPAHRADAHDALWQRNHPHPAVLEAVEADIARIRPGARLGAAEVAEDRRTLMLPVLAAQFVFGGEKGVAAAGVDHVARLDPVIRSTLGAHPQAAGARCALLELHDLVALTRAGAAFARMIEQHLVEILAPYLVGVRWAVADGTRERVGVVAALVGRLEIRPRLEHPQRAHFLHHAEALEYRQVHRQERLADVKTRVVLLLQRNYPVAAPGHQGRLGAAVGAAANHLIAA